MDSHSERRRRRSVPLTMVLGLGLVALACGGATPSREPARTPTSIAGAGQQSEALLTIALEYAVLGLGKAYAETGVTFVKPMPVFSVWGNLEPEAGRWVWGPLDALVLEYQTAGFSGMQILLSAESPWASSHPPRVGDLGDSFPQEQYLDDYGAFVTSVVERYDGDGVLDMPGLLFGVHQWGVEREFTGYWSGTGEEYVRLLRIAYPAIHSADPQAQVLLVALLLADGFDGEPTPAEIQQRLSRDVSFRKSLPETLQVLAACDSYDIADFHALAHYPEISRTAAWIREKWAAGGCEEKPIWIGDAFPMTPLVAFGGLVPPMPIAPVSLGTRDQAVALLRAVADPADPAHEASAAWVEAEVARELVKKVVVSAEARITGINVGNLEDWKTGLAGADKMAVPSLGGSMFMGLMDTKVTESKPGGQLPYTGHLQAKAREAGEPRPGFHAVSLIQERIGGCTSVQRLDMGTEVWAYRFECRPGPTWIAWYDDGAFYPPGQVPPSITVGLPFQARSARVTWVPTSRDEQTPRSITLEAGEILSLALGSTPLIVEEVH